MIQQQRTRWHDKAIKHKQFQKGNWALLYDSRIILGANVLPLAKLRGFKFLVGEYFVS